MAESKQNEVQEVKRVLDYRKLELEIKEFGPCYHPKRADISSIGYDLVVPRDFEVPAHGRCVIPLNICINLPFGMEAKIESRSGFSLRGMEGIGTRKRWRLLFGFIPWRVTEVCDRFDADVLVGKIDPGFHGNIGVIIRNNDVSFIVRGGTKIAQMTFYRVVSPRRFKKVEELSSKDRGGGYGHTGSMA